MRWQRASLSELPLELKSACGVPHRCSDSTRSRIEPKARGKLARFPASRCRALPLEFVASQFAMKPTQGCVERLTKEHKRYSRVRLLFAPTFSCASFSALCRPRVHGSDVSQTPLSRGHRVLVYRPGSQEIKSCLIVDWFHCAAAPIFEFLDQLQIQLCRTGDTVCIEVFYRSMHHKYRCSGRFAWLPVPLPA